MTKASPRYTSGVRRRVYHQYVDGNLSTPPERDRQVWVRVVLNKKLDRRTPGWV